MCPLLLRGSWGLRRIEIEIEIEIVNWICIRIGPSAMRQYVLGDSTQSAMFDSNFDAPKDRRTQSGIQPVQRGPCRRKEIGDYQSLQRT